MEAWQGGKALEETTACSGCGPDNHANGFYFEGFLHFPKPPFLTSDLQIYKKLHYSQPVLAGMKWEKRGRKQTTGLLQMSAYTLQKFLGSRSGLYLEWAGVDLRFSPRAWETQGSKLIFPWNYSIPVNSDEMRQKPPLTETLVKQNCWFLRASNCPW